MIFIQLMILLALLIMNIILHSFTLFDPLYTLITSITLIFLNAFYILLFIKPNMLKFKNYIIAFTLIITSLFSIVYGSYVSIVSVMDNNQAIEEEVQICAKDLSKRLNLINGQQNLYYTYYYCDTNEIGSPIIAKAKFKDTKKDKLSEFNKSDMISITYYKTAGYVLSMTNGDDVEVSKDEVKGYYLFLSFLLFICMVTFNQKNILKIQKKKLSEDEEYALFLLGKTIPKAEPESFVEHLKQEWENLTNMFRSKKNRNEDDEI